MGALAEFLEQIPDAFDLSTLLDPDVEKIESTIYATELVYKYFPEARRQFFEKPQVRISQREALNDPFEMSARWKDISTSGLRRYIKQRLQETLPEVFSNAELLTAQAREEFARQGVTVSPQQWALIEQRIKSEAGKSFIKTQLSNAQTILPIAVDHVFSNLEFQFQHVIDNVVSKFGVLSFTEDPLNELMWAHYASSGTGFVVGFDAHHPFFKGKDAHATKTLLRKVVYTDERADNFWRNPYYLFLVKGSGWAYEREWRMFKDLSECDEQSVGNGSVICLRDLPPEIIQAIYFGYCSQPDECKKYIDKITSFGSAPDFYRVQVNRQTGSLESKLMSHFSK